MERHLHVDLPGGVTGKIRMRAMSMADLKFYLRSDERVPIEAIERLEDAILSAEFSDGRPLDEQPKEAYYAILREWNTSEDEAALPPVNGLPSVSPSFVKSTDGQPVTRSTTRSTKSRGATSSRRGASTSGTPQ